MLGQGQGQGLYPSYIPVTPFFPLLPFQLAAGVSIAVDITLEAGQHKVRNMMRYHVFDGDQIFCIVTKLFPRLRESEIQFFFFTSYTDLCPVFPPSLGPLFVRLRAAESVHQILGPSSCRESKSTHGA